MSTSDDRPHTIEVTVGTFGEVIINYQDIPRNAEGWCHLSFSPEELEALIQTLLEAQHVALELLKRRTGMGS